MSIIEILRGETTRLRKERSRLTMEIKAGVEAVEKLQSQLDQVDRDLRDAENAYHGAVDPDGSKREAMRQNREAGAAGVEDFFRALCDNKKKDQQ